MFYDLASGYAQEIMTQEHEGQRVYEAVVGIVTDNKDPQKLGRVKVKYPQMSMDDSSWWAPVVMLGAGKNRGWFFIPEIDDEVLVLFEQGHLDRPIVIGAMWNGKDKPADKNPGGNPRRVIKSRSGSKITLDDEKGKILIEDGAKKGKIEFDAEANKMIFTAMDGDVCLQTPEGDTVIVAKSAEITAGQNLEIHSGKAMQLGSDANVKINGKDVTLSGAKANFNGGNAQMPEAPTADPQDVEDPYGS
jgi:uncharacterized protein involved in type VI secretion and phage assembly